MKAAGLGPRTASSAKALFKKHLLAARVIPWCHNPWLLSEALTKQSTELPTLSLLRGQVSWATRPSRTNPMQHCLKSGVERQCTSRLHIPAKHIMHARLNSDDYDQVQLRCNVTRYYIYLYRHPLLSDRPAWLHPCAPAIPARDHTNAPLQPLQKRAVECIPGINVHIISLVWEPIQER